MVLICVVLQLFDMLESCNGCLYSRRYYLVVDLLSRGSMNRGHIQALTLYLWTFKV